MKKPMGSWQGYGDGWSGEDDEWGTLGMPTINEPTRITPGPTPAQVAAMQQQQAAFQTGQGASTPVQVASAGWGMPGNAFAPPGYGSQAGPTVGGELKRAAMWFALGIGLFFVLPNVLGKK